MDRKAIIGFLLILLGALLFAGRDNLLDPGYIFGYYWPSLFVIPLGLLFHWMYAVATNHRAPGLLIPGGILLVSGLVCQVSMLFDLWSYLWPGFPLAVAFGLLEFYWFGVRNKWLLVPVFILGGTSVIFFAIFALGSIVKWNVIGSSAAVALIAAGFLLAGQRKNREFDET